MESFYPPSKTSDGKEILRKELDTILRFSALINSSLDIEEVLNSAMKWAEDFMDAEASTVYELDEERNELFVRLARGEKKGPVKSIRLKPGEGIAGRVIQSGKPRVVQDVTKEQFFSDKYDRMTRFRTRSMICVPLLIRERPIGVLQVLNKKSGAPFTRSDLELLTTISQQVAVALDNAKLYKRLREKFELTEQELKKTQEKLLRSERLAAMGHLVQGMAHEIRNPVTTIGGFAKRIKEGLGAEPRLRQYVNVILEETERLEDLVKEIHEFAQIQTADLNPHSLKELFQQVVGMFRQPARSQGVKLALRMSKDLPPQARFDFSQLSKALSHVIENAMESMPRGGRLSVSASQKEGYILIRIKDTGCGIAEEDLNSVYDPFVTSKTRGAGLGLTMVHQIMMNHRGEIQIESEKGKGTRVTLTLPIYP